MAREQPSTSAMRRQSGTSILRSRPSEVHSLVRFYNKTSCRADVIWFNYEGQGVRYKTLLPSQSVDVNTFVGHPWVFRDHDTGDRLVVHQEDVFQPEENGTEERWQMRRNVDITAPVRSLYKTCLRQLRNFTYNIPIEKLLGLQEWLPQHVVHELIHNHKIAAIYRRMAKGVFNGDEDPSSEPGASTSQAVPSGIVGNGNGNGEISSDDDDSSSDDDMPELEESPAFSGMPWASNSPGPGGDGLAMCQLKDKSAADGIENGVAPGTSAQGNGNSLHREVHVLPNMPFVGLNRRRLSPASLQARCTAALMSPCTVTTHSRQYGDGAAASPRLSPTAIGPGLLSTCVIGGHMLQGDVSSDSGDTEESEDSGFACSSGVQVHTTTTTPVHSAGISTVSQHPLAALNTVKDRSVSPSEEEKPQDNVNSLDDSTIDMSNNEAANNNHIEAKCYEASEEVEDDVHLNDNSRCVVVNGDNDKPLDM